MTTQKVSLTIKERLAAVSLFDSFKGSLSTLAVILEDVKKFVIGEEEWTSVGLVKTPVLDGHGIPTGSETWKWDETKGDTEIEMQKESADYLLAEIKKKSDAGEITLADVSLVSLEKKLK